MDTPSEMEKKMAEILSASNEGHIKVMAAQGLVTTQTGMQTVEHYLTDSQAPAHPDISEILAKAKTPSNAVRGKPATIGAPAPLDFDPNSKAPIRL